MAKKKKKGKSDKKPKTGISALEKALLVSKIQELKAKIDRRIECCEELDEAVSVYNDSYKRECEDKESIVNNLKQAIAELKLETRKLQDTFALTENKQKFEFGNLQNEVESLKCEKENVQQTLSKDICHLEKKLEELENFRAETANINKRIEEAEQKCVSQAEEFQQNLESRNKIAAALVVGLKCQLVNFLNMKGTELNQKFSLRPDPKYLDAIQESVSLEDTMLSLSERMIQLRQENYVLRAEAKTMWQQNDIMGKIRRELIAQEQGLGKVIPFLRSQNQSQDKQIQISLKRAQGIEFAKRCVMFVELKIQSFKAKLSQMKEEWEEREVDVRASEVKRLAQQELHMKIMTSIRQIEKVVKREAEKDPEDGKMPLEMILSELFGCKSKEVADHNYFDEAIDTFDMHEQDYNVGCAGVLFKNKPSDEKKTQSSKELRKDSVQDKPSVINLSTVDIISASLLAEVGLLGKFDIAKK